MQSVSSRRVLIVLSSFLCFVATAEINEHPNWKLLDHDKCGNSNTDRIIGGKNASLGAYPWIARIGYIESPTTTPGAKEDEINYRCGGSLINKLYVVTAAHCVTNLPATYKVAGVRLGEHNTETDPDCDIHTCSEPLQDFKPEKIVVHESYNDPVFKNDIAIIRLDKPVRYNEFVSPICIAEEKLSRRNLVGKTAEVAGWGIFDINNPKQSTVLQTLKVPIVELDTCRKSFRSHAQLGDEQMCVGGIKGKDSCIGDSGGPLMKVEAAGGPPRYYFIGVVSFGAKRCGDSNTPAVYSKISDYLRWILDNISP